MRKLNLIMSVIFPVFAIMVLGAIAEKFRLIGSGVAIGMNQYVTYFALPGLLFTSMATAPLHELWHWNFIVAYFLGMAATFVLCEIVAFLAIRKRLAIVSIQALSGSFSNVAYMGIPILLFLLGPRAVLPAIVITIITSIFLMVAIVLIEIDARDKKKFSEIIRIIFLTLVKSPLIAPSILGIAWNLTGWHLPTPIYTLGHELGVTAGTCALFAIGKIMQALHPEIEIKEQIIICSFKLIIQPLITVLLFFTFNVNDFWAACGFICAALPPATIIYILAQTYQMHQKNCSGIILMSTLGSIITLSIILALVPHIWPSLSFLAKT